MKYFQEGELCGLERLSGVVRHIWRASIFNKTGNQSVNGEELERRQLQKEAESGDVCMEEFIFHPQDGCMLMKDFEKGIT